MPHLVIMAAGTGGHIIPGIAVAREMQGRGWSVSWLGTTTGMENRLVPPTGIALDRLAFTGLRGKGLLHGLGGALRLIKAFWDAVAILRRRGATAVLGMGGYVCFPGGLMAGLLRKPLVLVNADAALLLSNQALLRVADCVAFGFDGPASAVRQGLVTGNPVRAAIEALPAPAQRFADRTGPLRLLVGGGSLGAQVLNRCVPQALALLRHFISVDGQSGPGRPVKPAGEPQRSAGAAGADQGQQTTATHSDNTGDNHPGGAVGVIAGEGFRQPLQWRLRGIVAEDQQDYAESQYGQSENASRNHGNLQEKTAPDESPGR